MLLSSYRFGSLRYSQVVRPRGIHRPSAFILAATLRSLVEAGIYPRSKTLTFHFFSLACCGGQFIIATERNKHYVEY